MAAEIIFLNGRFMAADEARVCVSSPGFLYGWGLFETMRAYHKRIVYLDAHLKRIAGSCRILGLCLPYPPDKLKRIIQEALELNYSNDARVRLTVWKAEKGTDISVSVEKYAPYQAKKYRDGFSVCVSRFRQNEDSMIARHKSANYLLYRLSYMEAKDKGFDEALILNEKGNIAEGSRSNIFFVKDREIFTPCLECGCLAGITRQVVFDLVPVNEGKFTVYDLYDADEVFLTNSLIGIMPVSRIEKRPLPSGKITAGLMKEYQRILKNGV